MRGTATYTHTHSHTHEGEEHDHEHPHDHDHEHTEHTHVHGQPQIQPADKLLALMRYMAGHNADHTRELEGLAGELKDAGNQEAYDLAMEAVRFFDQGNEALAKALEKMGK